MVIWFVLRWADWPRSPTVETGRDAGATEHRQRHRAPLLVEVVAPALKRQARRGIVSGYGMVSYGHGLSATALALEAT